MYKVYNFINVDTGDRLSSLLITVDIGVGTVYREFSGLALKCSYLVQKQVLCQNSFSYFRQLVTLAMTHKDEGSLGHVKCF